MGKLVNFLKDNIPETGKVVTFTMTKRGDDGKPVVVSRRFLDHDEKGNVIVDENGDPKLAEFKMQILKPSEYMQLADGAVSMNQTTMQVNAKSVTDISMNLVIKTLVEPDLTSVELQDSYGVMTAEELINEMFTPVEFTFLLNKANEIHAGNVSNDEMVDEVKNL